MSNTGAEQITELVRQKLTAFEQLRPEFEECFRFTQAVQGLKRFDAFPVDQVVYYLHALWVCERKDRLLGIYKNIPRYEGSRCLEILRLWQQGQNAGAVAFLLSKLNRFSFVEATAEIDTARVRQANEALIRYLEYGRLVVLHRHMNLLLALETLFSSSPDEGPREIRRACERYSHTPAQIEAQLAELEAPMYAYLSHPLLARQNMTVMNRLEMEVLPDTAHQPGERFQQARSYAALAAPFAEQVIAGYQPLPAIP